MSITDVLDSTLARRVISFVLYAALVILALFVVERSLTGALKAVKLAAKFEFTTDAGKLNCLAMVLFVVVIVVFNLHPMLSAGLSEGGASQSADHVIGPGILIGLFLLGSILSVLLLEKDK